MRKLIMVGLGSVCVAVSATAYATVFDYVQTGYPQGAVVNGSFEGSDLNNDGLINSFDGELTSFTFNYSGSSDIPAFSLDQSDFTTAFQYQKGGVVYDLDGTIDYSEDYIQVGNGFSSPFVALGGADGDQDFCASHVDCGFVDGDESGELIRVTAEAVPEPASWAMLIAGFGLVGAAVRRHADNISFA